MNKLSVVLLLVCATVGSESCAMKRFVRHPKDLFRQPKKVVTTVVRAIENQVLEPAAHFVENEVVEPAANGVNDHVIKPFFRGFKQRVEEHAERDGELAADAAHEALVRALTGGYDQETYNAVPQHSSDQEDEKRPAKRTRHYSHSKEEESSESSESDREEETEKPAKHRRR